MAMAPKADIPLYHQSRLAGRPLTSRRRRTSAGSSSKARRGAGSSRCWSVLFVAPLVVIAFCLGTFLGIELAQAPGGKGTDLHTGAFSGGRMMGLMVGASIALLSVCRRRREDGHPDGVLYVERYLRPGLRLVGGLPNVACRRHVYGGLLGVSVRVCVSAVAAGRGKWDGSEGNVLFLERFAEFSQNDFQEEGLEEIRARCVPGNTSTLKSVAGTDTFRCCVSATCIWRPMHITHAFSW